MSRLTVAPVRRRTTPQFTFILRVGNDPPRDPADVSVPLDLTGGAVNFVGKSAPDITGATLFNKTCTIDSDPTTGRCTVRLAATDIDTSGVIYCELVVVYTSGVRNGQTLAPSSFELRILEALS